MAFPIFSMWFSLGVILCPHYQDVSIPSDPAKIHLIIPWKNLQNQIQIQKNLLKEHYEWWNQIPDLVDPSLSDKYLSVDRLLNWSQALMIPPQDALKNSLDKQLSWIYQADTGPQQIGPISSTNPRRAKRGIVNAWGKVQSFLWGVATESELDEVQTTVKDLLQTQANLGVNIGKMVTNLTNHFLALDKTISTLAEDLANVTLTMIDKTTELERRLSNDEFQLSIDQTHKFCMKILRILELIRAITLTRETFVNRIYFEELAIETQLLPISLLQEEVLQTLSKTTVLWMEEGILLSFDYQKDLTKNQNFRIFQTEELKVGVDDTHIENIPSIPKFLVGNDKGELIGFWNNDCALRCLASKEENCFCQIRDLSLELIRCFKGMQENHSTSECKMRIVPGSVSHFQGCDSNIYLDPTKTNCTTRQDLSQMTVLLPSTEGKCVRTEDNLTIIDRPEKSLSKHILPSAIDLSGLLPNLLDQVGDHYVHPHVAAQDLTQLRSHLTAITKDLDHDLEMDQVELITWSKEIQSDAFAAKKRVDNWIPKHYAKTWWETILQFWFQWSGTIAILLFIPWTIFCILPAHTHAKHLLTPQDPWERLAEIDLILMLIIIIACVVILVFLCFLSIKINRLLRSLPSSLYPKGYHPVRGSTRIGVTIRFKLSNRYEYRTFHVYQAVIDPQTIELTKDFTSISVNWVQGSRLSCVPQLVISAPKILKVNGVPHGPSDLLLFSLSLSEMYLKRSKLTIHDVIEIK